MTNLNWNTSNKERILISNIAERGSKLIKNITKKKVDLLSLEMDITACHLNGCPLKLKKWLEADDFNFIHDISGISRNMNRYTGKLMNCFLPRFSI